MKGTEMSVARVTMVDYISEEAADEFDKAYQEIFSSNNLHENLSKINGEYKDNELLTEVIKFIEKDKKRPICSPQN